MLLIINQCLNIHILAFLVYHRLQNWVIFAAAFLLRIAIKSGRLHLKQKNCDRLTAAVIFQEKTPWSFNVRMGSFDSIPVLEGYSSNQPFSCNSCGGVQTTLAQSHHPLGVLPAVYCRRFTGMGPFFQSHRGHLGACCPPLDMEKSTHRGHKSFLRGQIKI